MAAERRAWRVADFAFIAGFGLYAAGAVAVLAQGMVAVAASASPELHETLHILGLGSGWLARAALRTADASHFVPSVGQITLDYAFSATHFAMAGVLLWLRPRDRTARLLALALVGVAGLFNLTSQAAMEQIPLLPVEEMLQTGAHILAGVAYVYALLLFPDGRPVPHWRPWALAPLYLPVTIGAVFLSIRVEGQARPAALLLFFGLLVPAVGAAAQAYRIRRTDDVTGQAQARLLFWALLPSVGLGLVFVGTNGLSPTTTVLAGRHLPEPPVALYQIFEPAFALIPLALLAGMLRYRLWDIERLASRTVVYAAATGVLGGAYIAFVLLAQLTLGTVTASPLIDSKPAVAVTTLLLVSAFRPLRDRIQASVDRRFNRRRYDAQVTVQGFSSQLRDKEELDTIASQLAAVVQDVMAPSCQSLWLRESVPNGARPETATTSPRRVSGVSPGRR